VTCEKDFVLTIIPTHNREQLLSETVESILAQDYPCKRIIIVDDGSTDETERVCRRYVKENPRTVRYQRKGNGGCASARNWGLSLIDEDIGYVCFLDDDDRLLPGKFTREVELLKKNPEADFSYADSIIYEEEAKSERLQKVAGACKPTHLAIEHFLTNEAKSAAILYRVHAVKQRRFREDLKYNEDSEFFQRIAIECKGVYSALPGCWVRSHVGCKSRNILGIREAVLRASVDILRSYPTFYLSNKETLDRQIDHNRYGLFVELTLKKRWDEAREYATSLIQNIFLICHLNVYYRFRRFVARLIEKRG